MFSFLVKVNSAMSEKILERARVELREDDVRKSQSLAQFREWLSKHPFIKKCRQGMSTQVLCYLLIVTSLCYFVNR